MNWYEVCQYPQLKNLPFKIELNERGQILMSPVKVYHSAYQGEIAHLLRTLLKDGRTLPECAIKTRKGTKVADVGWVSLSRFEEIKHESECSIAPEICVEVISSSNTTDEINEKKALYFERGADEVWICNKKGKILFYDRTGKIQKSHMAPAFLQQITL